MAMLVAQGASLGRQDALTPLLVYAVAAVLNSAGDILLAIHLNMGVAGTAWATLVAQVLGSAVFLHLLCRGPSSQRQQQQQGPMGGSEGRNGAASSNSERQLRVQLGWHGVPKHRDLKVYEEMALPLVTRCFLGMVVYTVLARAVANLGLLETAAHQVAMQVFWTLSYFSEPLSVAAQSLIALYAGSPQRAQGIASLLVWIAGGLGAGLALMLGAVVHRGFPGGVQLTSDAGVMALVRSVAPQAMLSQLMCAVSITLEGIAIGSGDYAYLPRMQLLVLGMVLASLVVLATQSSLSLSGIWWCLVIFFSSRLSYHLHHLLASRRSSRSALFGSPGVALAKA